MSVKLAYVIKFVTDMDKSIKFYRDILGLPLKLQSPKWTEFKTGKTILALHLTTSKKIAGTVQLGFNTDKIDAFYKELKSKKVKFTRPPVALRGIKLAEFLDNSGTACTLSG